MTHDHTVAVLGTGIMGTGMALNLLGAGLEVRVWNRSRNKAAPLAERGATVADSPTEAAQGADFLITMLSDAGVIEEVIQGGALIALAPGGVWLQMSTVGISGTEQLSRHATEHNVPFLDAPVVGTKEPAERGMLTILASGPEDARDKSKPVLDAVANSTLWLGTIGSGTRLKLVVNNWIAGMLGVLAETISLSSSLHVDPGLFLEVIEGRPLNAPYAQQKGKMMIEEDFATSFPLELARKDVELILDAADNNGLPLALTNAIGQRLDEAVAAGHGMLDMSAIYEVTKP